MSGWKARLAAAQLLTTVVDEGRTLDDAMASTPAFGELSGPDRGFARAMASAALRHLGRIDQALGFYLEKPLHKAGREARALLRIGAAQSWLLETPDHAVVGETVGAAKHWQKAQGATGFVNAVLRRVVGGRGDFEALPILSVWPDWLQKLMVEQLGQSAANALATAQTETPDLYLTPKDGDPESLAATLSDTQTVAGSVRVETGQIEGLAGYEEGMWWVQDVAATLPARLLGVEAGENVLDLCAAPGGKTLQLAALGANVTAVDRSKPRLKRLKQNLWRMGYQDSVKVIQADASAWAPDQPMDRVLLDAPCSALGTLRRHPEGAWIKTQDDVLRFPIIQIRLLRSAIEMLKPGGTLIYCVCSPLRHEGLDIVEDALGQGRRVRRKMIEAAEVPGFEASLTTEGDLLTLPGNDFSHDAFYISRLEVVA